MTIVWQINATNETKCERNDGHDGTSPTATFEIKNEPHVEIMENNINIVNKKQNIL